MRSPTHRYVTAFSIRLGLAPVRTLIAQTNRPAAGHWACFSGFEFDPIYVTPVWDGTATMENVQTAFTQMLATRYGYQGRVSCSRANMSGSTLAGVEAGRKDRDAQWEKSGKKVVQTGWTFGAPDPAPAAPAENPPSPSPSPAAASPEPAKWAVCRMTGALMGATKSFVSAVMEPPGTIDKDSLERAFARFLGTKFKVTPHNTECATSPSQSGAAAKLKAWMDEAAKHRARYGPTADTRWVYAGAA